MPSVSNRAQRELACRRSGLVKTSALPRSTKRPTPRYLVILALFGLSFLGPAVAYSQYTPEHPKVRAMVDRGIRYMETADDRAARFGEYRIGAEILVGYTIFKATGDPEHPLVKRSIATSENIAREINKVSHNPQGKIIYESSMAAVMLASVDAAKYAPLLNEVMYFFDKAQKDHGGFGYLGRQTGDTSQVQYVMLAIWTMKEVGVDISPQMVESTLEYLKATIDPSGSWGYQGVISNGRPAAQEKVSKSLGTAGIGALIIGGDALGFYGTRKKAKEKDDGVPEAFVRIDLKAKERARLSGVTMSRADTDGTVNAAVRYQNRNPQFSGAYWYYYWRYSQERYESFVEIVNNRQEKSPPWYNQGVDELSRFQDDDGGWGDKKTDVTPRTVSTAFSVLFLIRSTQKAIGQIDAGLTFGGRELPSDLTSIRMQGERLVSDEETSVENLLEMLEDDAAGSVQIGLLPENLQLHKDPEQRKEQVARLSRLLINGDYKARRVAARLLGRSEDLRVVPDLIFALTDQDPHVPVVAEESLRLLSRKLNSGKLKLDSSMADKTAAESFWKAWYLGLRPEYIFIER
ncbi:MAG: hypothetical protein AB8B50_01085 [Pirellulaceae bacterium]